jgi:hypothetical protein
MDAYLTCGTSSSSFFTEGLNTGHNLIRGADAFLTYMDYWGLGNTSQNEVAGKLLIYPNPSSNSVNISPPANRKEGSTVIFNMVGQQLFSTSLPENEPFEINTTAWNAGIYIVRWQGNDGLVLTEKLIIK